MGHAHCGYGGKISEERAELFGPSVFPLHTPQAEVLICHLTADCDRATVRRSLRAVKKMSLLIKA